MNRDLLLEQLIEVLEKCGITFELGDLSDDELNIKSGFCIVESEKKLIVDKRLSSDQRVNVILKTLRLENLENVYLPPAVREIIETGER